MEELFNPDVPVFISIIVLVLCSIVAIKCVSYIWDTFKTVSTYDENTSKLDAKYYNKRYLKSAAAFFIMALSAFAIQFTMIYSTVIGGCAIFFIYLCFKYLFKFHTKITSILFKNRTISNNNLRVLLYVPYGISVLFIGSLIPIPILGPIIMFVLTIKKIRPISTGRCEKCRGTLITHDIYDLGLKHKLTTEIHKKTTIERDKFGNETETTETTTTPIHQAFKMYEDVFICEECGYMWNKFREGAMVLQKVGPKKYDKKVR